MYVPNPSCRDFAKYEWIGQLMGAALRGKEFLVSSLIYILSDQPWPLEGRANQTQEAQGQKIVASICPTGLGSAWFRVEAALW